MARRADRTPTESLRYRRRSLGSTLITLCVLIVSASHAQGQYRCEPSDPPLATLYGEVRSETGEPVEGVSVLVTWESGEAEALSRADGSYLLCSVPHGVSITITAAGALAVGRTHDIELPYPERFELDLDVESIANKPTVTGSGADSGAPVGAARSRIVGSIVDQSTHRPVEGALVTIVGVDRQALTDSRGKFLIREAPPGRRVMQVDHVAYGEVLHALDLPHGLVTEVTLELSPRAIPVEPIIVTAVHHPRLQVRGFYDRRDQFQALGLGEFITEEDIRQWPAARLSSLVSRIPMVRTTNLCPGAPGIGGYRCADYVVLSGRGRWAHVFGNIVRVPCPAEVWINGTKARTFSWGEGNKLILLMGIDELGLPSEVAGVEVYSRASELPAEFGGATDGCGAVVIWTK